MKRIAKPDFLKHASDLYTSDVDENLQKKGGKAIVASIEEQGEELVTLWQPFEHYPREEVCEAIEDASKLLEQMWEIGFRAGQANPKPVKKRQSYNKSERYYDRYKTKGGKSEDNDLNSRSRIERDKSTAS